MYIRKHSAKVIDINNIMEMSLEIIKTLSKGRLGRSGKWKIDNERVRVGYMLYIWLVNIIC